MIDRRRYRKVFVRIWSNPEFRNLQDGERVMALYLLSGPQTNRVGLFRVSLGAASEDLGASMETVRKRLERVCVAFRWEFDECARVLYIPSWWSFNVPGENEKNMMGALSDLNEVPRTHLIDKFCNNLECVPKSVRGLFTPWRAALTPTTLNEHRSNDVRTQETRQDKQEQEQEREPAPRGGAFDAFWLAYPKKKSRSDAEKAWRKLAPSPELTQRIMDAIAAQRNSPDWLKEGGKYIPYPASWLNGRRWEDEAEVVVVPPVLVEPVEDWFEECQRIHGGDCGLDRWRHHLRKEREAVNAKAG